MSTNRQPLRPTVRIAHLGLKGIPATYGGVERYVEELAARQAARGHRVTVYCRAGYTPRGAPRRWRGARVARLPAPPFKHLNNIAHTALAVAAAWRDGHDLLHFHGVGPSLLCGLPRFFGATVVATVHALDWKQAKWSAPARAALRAGEWCAARMAGAVTAVSREIVGHLARAHGVRAWHTPPGVLLSAGEHAAPSPLPPRLGVTPGAYDLAVGRIIADKDFPRLLRAHRAAGGRVPLVVVGEAEAGDRAAWEDLRREAAASGNRVVLAGYCFGAELAALYAGCRAYLHPSHQEGLSLSLLEAMAAGAPVVAADIPANREAAGADGAVAFVPPRDERALADAILRVEAISPAGREAIAQAARASVARRFDWEKTADVFDAVYAAARRGRRGRGVQIEVVRALTPPGAA
ncbi:MAG: glycosyltransferase family 4 protein [Planctomycetes bacterium]|nr:glycosyltransferase family 4 protein [Planctomycetota bacterium]